MESILSNRSSQKGHGDVMLKEFIESDLYRFSQKIRIKDYLRVFTNHSFKLTFWYRIGNYCLKKNNLYCRIILPFVKLIHQHNQYLTGIQLPLGTCIGKSIFFIHYSGIVINEHSIIGNNVTVFHNVTIGANEFKGGSPSIGNNVVLAAGCKIIGPITIGNNVYVGANSVVTRSVPDNCVVCGVPAKILNYEGEKYTSIYNKK